jgi:hypothetical protein
MVRINLILVFFCIVFTTSAQDINCGKINDSFFFVEMDIRRINNYPIIMSGVCKKVDFDLFIKDNEELFVSSFYKMCYYVPYIQGDNKKTISNCLGDMDSYEYLYDYRDQVLKMSYNINKNSLEKTIKLKNNCTVSLKISKINGLFIVVDKRNKYVSKNSNELEINDIIEIDKIYIPLKIFTYKKPISNEVF